MNIDEREKSISHNNGSDVLPLSRACSTKLNFFSFSTLNFYSIVEFFLMKLTNKKKNVGINQKKIFFVFRPIKKSLLLHTLLQLINYFKFEITNFLLLFFTSLSFLMSIAVGKRTFDQQFSQMMINDFPMNSLYRSKMVLNENNALNRNFYLQPTQSSLNENAQILRQHFPRLDDKVCDWKTCIILIKFIGIIHRTG